MGMAGGLSLPRPVPRDAIRREGNRRGFDGEALEDFVEMVVAIDDGYVEITVKREAENAKLAAERSRKKR